MYSFIVINYNSHKLIQKLYESIKQNMTSYWELIIVDNFTSHEERSRLVEFFENIKNVKIIFNESNLGFGKACNIGVEASIYNTIILVNPDVILVEKGLENFIEKNLHSNFGVLAPRILYENGDIQPNGGSFNGMFFYILYALKNILSKDMLYKISKLNFFQNTSIGEYRKNFEKDTEKIIKYDWVSGAFMVIKKDVYKKVGGFDKNFFMYTEDKDLCYQIKNKLGLNTYVDASYSIVHSVGGTQNKSKNYDMEVIKLKSRIYYIYKNYGILKAFILKYFYILILLINKNNSLSHIKEIYKYKINIDSATVIGYYGSGNVGDECILKSLLQEYSFTNVFVLSKNPKNTELLHRVNSYQKKSVFSIAKCLFNSTNLIIGGGGLFLKNNTSTYIYFYLLTLLFKIMKKKIYIDGVGLNYNALEKRSHKFIFSQLIAMSNYIKVRDDFSYKYIMDVYSDIDREKIQIRNDFVFDFLERNKNYIHSEKKNIAGVSLMNINIDYSPIKEKIKYYMALNYIIKFYVFFESEGDLEKAKEIIRELSIDNAKLEIVILKNNEDFDRLFSDLSNNEVFISMRFHPMLISYKLGAKVYVLPHNSKINDFATKYGLNKV